MYATDRKSIRIAIVGAVAAGLLQVAHALGLGPITVNSHIGEPLQATINVTGLDAAQRANTTVSIADNAAYRSRGIEKLPSHEQLNLSLQSSSAGHYINISTPNVVREPFITFILSIKQNGKETLREYTVFLDPPIDGLTVPLASTPEAKTTVAAPAKIKLLVDQPASTTTSGWKGTMAKPVTAAPVIERGETKNWQGRNYGPVKQGETLFSIAEKVRPSADYSIQTVMHQIYRANPHAFNRNQLSGLMAGYNLSIPVFTKDLVSLPTQSQKTSAPPIVDEPIQSEPVEESISIVGEQETANTDDQMFADNRVEDESPLQEEFISDEDKDSIEHTESTIVSVQEESDPILQNTLVDSDQSSETDLTAANDLDTGHSENEATNLELKVSDQEELNESDISLVENKQFDASNDNGLVNHENTAVSTDVNQVETNEIVETQNVSEPVSNTTLPETDLVIKQQPITEEQPAQSFLNTSYAFLPLWQWLIVVALIFGLIALLLFKQRKKHAVDESDTLDEAEMDAVLAKINALESEESADSDDSWLSKEQYDDKLDSQDQPIEQLHYDDSDMVFDESQSDDESYKYESHDSDSDPDMLFNEEELMSDINQNVEISTDDSDIEDDYDFFIDDEPQEYSDNITNFDIEDDTDEIITTDTDHHLNTDDDLDLFIEDIDNVEPAAAVVKEDTKHISDEPVLWSDQEDDLDDLFIGDIDLESEDASIIDEESIKTTPSAENTSGVNSHDSLLTDNDEQIIAVNQEEMEINLDLAISFMATGHGERAVIWLEEVMNVGTEEQRARAKALLDKVRGA